MKISSVQQMRDMDSNAVKRFGIPNEILMENAGNAVYSVIREHLGVQGQRFVVLCGGGNNGGDGFVVARKLYSSMAEVRVFVLGDVQGFKGAAQQNMDILAGLGVDIIPLDCIDTLLLELERCDAVVDAIFGTGLSRPVKGLYGDVIDQVNKSDAMVFSVDIPSGVSGDTGAVMGTAVNADHTVTFGLPKKGNLLFPGFDQCGELHVSHISFPPALYNDDAIKIECSLPARLAPRGAQMHKGSAGKALFIAGAASYYGAPYLCAMSFLKTGGGYSRLACPASMVPVLAGMGPEIVFVPMKETREGGISVDNMDELVRISRDMDMVVLGPGLSLGDECAMLVQRLTSEIPVPLIIDGDGITAISRDLDCIRKREAPTILTPHAGEMARMVGMDIKEIHANPVNILQTTAADLGAVIVLKGAHSLTGMSDKRVFINMSGNPGMATAGSGDVLTGTIAAMKGLGLGVEQAVLKGVFMHGAAGDIAASRTGADGMTARDIMESLPHGMKTDREEGLDRDYEIMDIV
ncbi:MAG: NAD(P)H-hydrate dehydratase [Thermodesulfobacteriota bacterium]|nr:NAD(P)H-hydrate dehydratase [Thermodesulfobacteriota bacterium]